MLTCPFGGGGDGVLMRCLAPFPDYPRMPFKDKMEGLFCNMERTTVLNPTYLQSVSSETGTWILNETRMDTTKIFSAFLVRCEPSPLHLATSGGLFEKLHFLIKYPSRKIAKIQVLPFFSRRKCRTILVQNGVLAALSKASHWSL